MEERILNELLSKVHDGDEEKYELGHEHLPFLFRTLHELAEKWPSFCLQLGVKDIDQIRRNGTGADDCLVLGLQSWLQGDTVSWKRLIEAIYQPAGGGYPRLARIVAESFRGDSYTDIESAVADIQKMLDSNVAPRWYQMGVTMGAQVRDLESVRLEKLPASESEARALKSWLRKNATWQRLVDAVGHRAGGNYKRLATSLSKKIAKQLSDSKKDEISNGQDRGAQEPELPPNRPEVQRSTKYLPPSTGVRYRGSETTEVEGRPSSDPNITPSSSVNKTSLAAPVHGLTLRGPASKGACSSTTFCFGVVAFLSLSILFGALFFLSDDNPRKAVSASVTPEFTASHTSSATSSPRPDSSTDTSTSTAATQRELPNWGNQEPTLKLLSHIKYQDPEGHIMDFYLIGDIQMHCRELGTQLGIDEPTLQSLTQQKTAEACKAILNEWITRREGDYDITWGGLFEALQDVRQLKRSAELLEKALTWYFKSHVAT